jgi:hypothetical protein
MQRLSDESQFSIVNLTSRGSAASLIPIYTHSFERQPKNETAVVLSIKLSSDALSALSVNFIKLSVGYFWHV